MNNLVIQEKKKVYSEETVVEVDHFVYLCLGNYIDQERDTRKEVRIKIAKAALAFLEKIRKAKLQSTRTKLRIFSSSVISILTYAHESWKTTKK